MTVEPSRKEPVALEQPAPQTMDAGIDAIVPVCGPFLVSVSVRIVPTLSVSPAALLVVSGSTAVAGGATLATLVSVPLPASFAMTVARTVYVTDPLTGSPTVASVMLPVPDAAQVPPAVPTHHPTYPTHPIHPARLPKSVWMLHLAGTGWAPKGYLAGGSVVAGR